MPEDRLPVCDYEGSDYQEAFWDGADRAYEDRVEAIALQRLLPMGGKRLLELGAGAGRNTSRYQGFDQIVLLDYSRTQLEQAMARHGEGDRFIYVAADVYRLPFRSNVFDGATMIRTLHHLVDPKRALKNIRETLAEGSIFILEFANKRNIKAILRWLLGRQTWNPFDAEQVEFAELNFNFHPRAIRSIVRSVGFNIHKTLTVSHFRIGFLKRWVPLGILVGVDALVQWTGALWQLSPSVFLRLALPGEHTIPRTGEIFSCPECRHEQLQEQSDGLRCDGCGRVWGYQDGIYDFKNPIRMS
jgi:ubiquinone/menaquinone biosynthesis C-methylase UbiE